MHTHLLLWKYARLREPRSLFRVQWLGALVAGTIQASSRENRLLKNAAVFEKNVLRFNHFFRKLDKMRYGHIFYYHPVYSVSSIIYTPSCISYITGLRNRLQNTPGSAILLVVNKVIPILIGPSKKPTMYDRGRGTWPGNLAVSVLYAIYRRGHRARKSVTWLGVFWRRSLNMFW